MLSCRFLSVTISRPYFILRRSHAPTRESAVASLAISSVAVRVIFREWLFLFAASAYSTHRYHRPPLLRLFLHQSCLICVKSRLSLSFSLALPLILFYFIFTAQ